MVFLVLSSRYIMVRLLMISVILKMCCVVYVKCGVLRCVV